MSVSRTALTRGMKRIQFSATYPSAATHPLHRRIVDGSPVARADLLMWSPTAEATTLFWFDGDRDAARTVIDGIDSLLVSNIVEDVEGTYAFLQQDAYEFPTAVLDTIANARVIFLPPVVFRDTGAVEFEAVGEAAALSAFYDELSELAEVTIRQVHEFERERSPSRLTDRQRAALDAAMAVGYYEVPREGGVSDVARVLDCSTSTAGELLRKAEAAALREYCETDSVLDR